MGEQRPTEAFALSLIGGIFVILGGVAIVALGALFSRFIFGGTIFLIGGLGVMVGVVICVGAIMIYINPAHSEAWGIIIIMLSIASWFVSLGGFFIGFLLALIGGILATSWKPAPRPQFVWVPQPPVFLPSPPPPPPPPPPTAPLRMCVGCGRQIEHNSKFCKECGKPVPA